MLWSHSVSECTKISWVSGILSALPLGWTHSPLHTLYFSSSIYHMALKFPFIFLSSSASLASSSSVQTWSSSCLAQSKQSFNKDWLTWMLNERNIIKNLNKEYTNRLRLIQFITVPVPEVLFSQLLVSKYCLITFLKAQEEWNHWEAVLVPCAFITID